jgi:hypothetical protein
VHTSPEAAPLIFEYLPRPQEVQFAAAITAENFPASHSVHVLASVPENFPAPHCKHEVMSVPFE